MVVDTESVIINLVRSEHRYEITVVTVDGERILFPDAKLEVRSSGSGRSATKTMYFYATKTDFVPAPRTITLIVEQPEDAEARHRLDITPLNM
jgi:hypothetical protein